MNGSIYFDGRHYDALWSGLHRQNELAFYRQQIERYGEPALELGCGTGQLTLPLAEGGIAVTGLDLAEPMLAHARYKAAERDIAVPWMQADCRDFVLDQRFGLIFFPANSLLHLLEWRDLQRCLARVREHLKPGGAFAFEIFNPSLTLLTRAQEQRSPVGSYPDPDGRGIVTITENNLYDAASQINRIRWYYQFEGQMEETQTTLDLRMYFPQEIEALLHYNGFKIEAHCGDYAGAPFTGHSPRQLIVCIPK